MAKKVETLKIDKSFKEYLEDCSKKDLITIIIGDEKTPPIITINEPLISRPQLIWAFLKYNKAFLNNPDKFEDIEDEFHRAEDKADYIMEIVNGLNWNNFYNYDWIRFDIRKPGFKYFIGLLVTSVIGIISIISFIINLF